MLKARTTAGGATAIAAVEAELGCRVAALLGQRGDGKYLAHGIPCADVAGGVRTCGFADGGLIDKHHVTQVVRTQQSVMSAGCFGGASVVTQQRGSEDVLNKGRFARATDTRDTHQALQRELDAQVLQVVLARAFENQSRCVVGHQTLEAETNGFASA